MFSGGKIAIHYDPTTGYLLSIADWIPIAPNVQICCRYYRKTPRWVLSMRVGRPLIWNPDSETFEDAEANQWLRREQRAGYEID